MFPEEMRCFLLGRELSLLFNLQDRTKHASGKSRHEDNNRISLVFKKYVLGDRGDLVASSNTGVEESVFEEFPTFFLANSLDPGQHLRLASVCTLRKELNFKGSAAFRVASITNQGEGGFLIEFSRITRWTTHHPFFSFS